jgi:threonine dehydratase
VALAAALAGRLPVTGRTVVVVCSGGNVDPKLYMQALSHGFGHVS